MKTTKNQTKNILFSWNSGKIEQNSTFQNVSNGVELPLITHILQNIPKPVIVIFPQLSDAEKAMELLPSWGEVMNVKIESVMLPETISAERYIPENEAMRARVVHKALNDDSSVFIGSVSALLSGVPDAGEFLSSAFTLRTGEKILIRDIISRLLKMDYDDEFESGIPGEFSRRGGIVDIFSPAYDYPARIEFFGDTIESIRLYSPGTQRTFRTIDTYTVIPRSSMSEAGNRTPFINLFNKKSPSVITIFPSRCREHLERFGERDSLTAWKTLINGKDYVKAVLLDPSESDSFGPGTDCGCRRTTDLIYGGEIPEQSDSLYSEWRRQLSVERINQWIDTGYSVTITGTLDSSRKHITAWCRENKIDPSAVNIEKYSIPFGLTFLKEKLVIMTEKELFTSTPHHHTATPLLKTLTDTSPPADNQEENLFSFLEPGDYAVHIDYGICRYHGITEIRNKNTLTEMFKLEFADELILYLPLFQANLISKYIGSKNDLPKLSKKGGKQWIKSKIEASRDIRNMAVELLEVQAMRMGNKGYAFQHDDLWQHLFEESFPFPETPDQKKAADEIKNDMASERPMDRLLCGDVGYGKTEVAMRAAFKAVMEGKQVAILVPTTILAQQHYYTFRDRFAEYPVIIDLLSRFRTAAEQKQTLAALRERKIDIIIGTHRLIQNDVKFSDLGLLIIDEEQRFGVTHKEKLKRFRTTVDILTMTATPIPRTLYMSMTGLRDLSTIMSPPNARLPIRTYVCKEDYGIAADAIRKEMQRGGQVYYLHNRVKTIHRCSAELQALVPEARFATAHGRMDEKELEKVMGAFLDGKIDVLVCTTIIESGLDIPNANTIIIERADRFGLSELYQLRGRVGRWHRQAYSYMFLPRDLLLTGNARKRIAAIRRYSELGAGFRLAMRDLEIRGAGNILGATQSGHINTIGFDLYCQLLRAAIDEQQKKSTASFETKSAFFASSVNMQFDFIIFSSVTEKNKISASLPESYIPSEKQRVSFFRRIGNINTNNEFDEITAELKDRFGDLPEQVKNFLTVMKIRMKVAAAGYNSIQVKKRQILIKSGNRIMKINGKIPVLTQDSPEAQLEELSAWIFHKKNRNRCYNSSRLI